VTQQRSHDVRLVFHRREHQRVFAELLAHGVHLSSVLEQQFHHRRLSGARGSHEHSLAVCQRGVGVCPGIEKLQHHWLGAVGRGQHQRGDSEPVGRINLGSRAKQQASRF
jgi:hypothetical protein